jgi:stage II sporulation protein D
MSSAGILNAKKRDKEPIIRVKLGSIHQKVEVASENASVTNSRNRRIATIRKNRKFSWQLKTAGNRRNTRYKNETLSFTSRNNILTFNGKKYRGQLKIKFSEKGATVVNHVGIEDYLRGVVGSEMGSLSPAESLKAQTVIARTYAYSNKGKHGRDGADVCDSTHCQVYKGISAERKTINNAIKATRGIIMVSDGKPVQTLYHAACGGMTSDNDKVFGGAATSYLRRVVCPFCSSSPHYRWRKSLTIDELRKGLAKEKINFNRVFKVNYQSDAPLDRVKKITFLTDRGKFTIKGTTFRRLFSLKSTTFTLGNRESIKQLISIATMAQPESLKTGETAKGPLIASLGNMSDDGPPQLIIQNSLGLKRVKRPEEGWKTISFGKITKPEKKTSTHQKNTKPETKSYPVPYLKKIEIFGRGFGHQVGLCQAGAIEMGKRNWSYRQILPFYYSNVALRKLNY